MKRIEQSDVVDGMKLFITNKVQDKIGDCFIEMRGKSVVGYSIYEGEIRDMSKRLNFKFRLGDEIYLLTDEEWEQKKKELEGELVLIKLKDKQPKNTTFPTCGRCWGCVKE